MRIKKHPTGNQYLYTKSGVWVRNFVTPVFPLDINKLSSTNDYTLFLRNEITNDRNDLSLLDINSIKFNSGIIISDGYDFNKKQELLLKIPKNVAIITTNRSLFKWKIDRKIDFFVVNNPYKECMNFLPNHKYYPKCVVSTKTYPDFVSKYKERGGTVLGYSSSVESEYSSPIRSTHCLDDYRNPICASISLAYKLGITKLLLFCCDDSFPENRPASVPIDNGLYSYEQHILSQNIIAGMLFWYKKIKNSKVGDHSSGLVYEDAPYIKEEEIEKFF